MLCWLQITSGRGPDEWSWVVSRVVEAMTPEASANGCHMHILEIIPGRPRLYRTCFTGHQVVE